MSQSNPMSFGRANVIRLASLRLNRATAGSEEKKVAKRLMELQDMQSTMQIQQMEAQLRALSKRNFFTKTLMNVVGAVMELVGDVVDIAKKVIGSLSPEVLGVVGVVLGGHAIAAGALLVAAAWAALPTLLGNAIAVLFVAKAGDVVANLTALSSGNKSLDLEKQLASMEATVARVEAQLNERKSQRQETRQDFRRAKKHHDATRKEEKETKTNQARGLNGRVDSSKLAAPLSGEVLAAQVAEAIADLLEGNDLLAMSKEMQQLALTMRTKSAELRGQAADEQKGHDTFKAWFDLGKLVLEVAAMVASFGVSAGATAGASAVASGIEIGLNIASAGMELAGTMMTDKGAQRLRRDAEEAALAAKSSQQNADAKRREGEQAHRDAEHGVALIEDVVDARKRGGAAPNGVRKAQQARVAFAGMALQDLREAGVDILRAQELARGHESAAIDQRRAGDDKAANKAWDIALAVTGAVLAVVGGGLQLGALADVADDLDKIARVVNHARSFVGSGNQIREAYDDDGAEEQRQAEALDAKAERKRVESKEARRVQDRARRSRTQTLADIRQAQRDLATTPA